MRWRLMGLGMLGVALGGCGTMRPSPVVTEAQPLIATRVPSGPAPLGYSEHPEIDRWEARLRARPSVDARLARGHAWVSQLEPLLEDEGLPAAHPGIANECSPSLASCSWPATMPRHS